MNKMTEDEFRRSMDSYSGKSEDELMTELSGFNISKSDFDSFMEIMLPMLNEEQKKRLYEIRESIIR